MFFLLLFVLVIVQGNVYFVTENGNDNNNGTTTTSAFRTLSRALQATRETGTNQTIVLSKGTFSVPQTTVLTSQDNGLAVQGAGRELTTLSGGQVLMGQWKQIKSSADGALWSMPLPEGPSDFNQLFVDGERAVRARHPNQGSFSIIQAPLPPDQKGFYFSPGDLPTPDTPHLDEVELVVYASWQASRRQVAAIHPANHTVVMQNGCSIQFQYPNTGRRFYAENYLAAADSPGEWFLDRHASPPTVYYFAASGTDPNKGNFVAPVVKGDLVVLAGTTGVTLRNLTVSHTDWGADMARVMTSSGGCQAASWLNSSAVRLTEGTTQSLLEGFGVSHVGEYGLWIHGGSTHNTVRDAVVSDLGAGGIRIGTGKPLMDVPDGTAFNQILDTTVVLGSHVFHEGNGILLQKSSFNTISHCEVAFFNHCGISVGWTWDYVPSEAHHNTIEFNRVHHVGNGDLTDLAGIYLLGISTGTVVRHNHVHDSYPFYKYGHGIYLDQASSNVLIEGNLVHNTEAALFLLHYGMNVTVRNNILALSTGGFGHVWQNTNPGWPSSGVQSRASHLTFESNIVYVDASHQSDPPLDAPWDDTAFPLFQSPYRGNNSFGSNLYWNASAATISDTFPSWVPGTWQHQTANRSFEVWQKAGQDLGSLVADPRFAKVSEFDFTLSSTSPAFKLPGGFAPLNVSQAGPRVRHDWRPVCRSRAGVVFGSCAAPPVPANGFIKGTSDYKCGTSVSYNCRNGFVLKGPFIRTCNSEGWSGSDVVCQALPLHPNTMASEASGGRNMLQTGDFLQSTDKASFLIMQTDGNLALYRGSGPSDNKGLLWDSGVSVPASPQDRFHTVMQDDGNLCTYQSPQIEQAGVWCSGVAPGAGQYYLFVNATGIQVREGMGRISDQGLVWEPKVHISVTQV